MAREAQLLQYDSIECTFMLKWPQMRKQHLQHFKINWHLATLMCLSRIGGI